MKWLRKNLGTINIVLTLSTGAIAAGGTLAQACMTGSQKSTLPQVEAKSVSELRIQVEDRRSALAKEIQALDELLKDLTKAEAALRLSPNAPSDLAAAIRLDSWWLTALKTCAVYFVLVLSISASLVAGVMDLVSYILGYGVRFLGGLWRWSWQEVTIGWYWQKASATGVGAGVLLMFLPVWIGSFMEAREKRAAKPEPELQPKS